VARISRRRFLAGAGAAVLPFTLARANSPASDRSIVIGAGLSGLAAAYELMESGADVLVVEQSDRAGGRVKTIRGHFDDDAWVDVGGQTSGGGYANFFYYSTKLGLEFEPQSRGEGRPDILMHLGGDLHSLNALRAEPDAWPVDLTDDEKARAPLGLLGQYIGTLAAEIGAVENVLKRGWVHFDELSLRQLLEQRGASEAAIQMIDHTLNYNSVDTVSALSALRDAARRLALGAGGPGLNLANGNSSLPDAFARELGDRIQFGTAVRGIKQLDDSVQLQVETRDGDELLYAGRIVIAVPFTALRKITIEPGLPRERQTIIDELPYTQIAQAYLQTRTRFWETNGPVAMVVSDGPLERLFNASSQMTGDRGLLVNWVNGTGTNAIDAADPDKHIDLVLRHMNGIWPGSREQVERTLSNNWTNSWVEGAYAHYAPGQMAAHAATIGSPIGRLHFAGEHTELVAPGMEGALTSGKRAASEIMAAAYN